MPSGDIGAVLDRALTLLVADLQRRRCAATPAPRASSSATAGRRYVPSPVRRAVWKRDAGRCASWDPSGRCTETGWLEFHHVHPYAEGGSASVENIQLRCRAHNQYEARLWFVVLGTRSRKQVPITGGIRQRRNRGRKGKA